MLAPIFKLETGMNKTIVSWYQVQYADVFKLQIDLSHIVEQLLLSDATAQVHVLFSCWTITCYWSTYSTIESFMSIMVTSPAEGKRRFRDQTLAMNINASSEPDELASIKRRQTIGGDARPRSSSAVDLAATVLPTPTKHKVNLGSTAASAYYFSGIPKTPLSSAKSPSNAGGTDSGKAPQTTSSDGDDSTPSTGASDIMNKSVLSDTTELTASNFVRVASSRMQVTGLQKFMSEYSLQSELLAQSAIQSQTQDSLDYAYTAASTVSSHGKVSTSPSTLRKFTRTLKQSRLSTDEEFEGPSKRSNNESSIAPSFVSPITKGSDDQTQKQSSSRDLDVSLASLDDLFDGLMSATRMESSPERSLLASPQSDTDRSPFLEATESTNEVDKKPRSSFLSPGVSPIDRDHAYEAPFRLTPCKTSTTLTPTKLNPSPRRVLNLNVADSPARNTRSASKSAPSDQLGLSNETVGPGESLIHGSPSRFVTTSNPKQVLEMDDEGSSGNRPGVFTKYSSAIEDSKRRRAESEAEAYYPSGPGKKRKGGDFGDEGLPIAGSSTLRESKSECASVPKSILNSTKKKQNAPEYLRRKSVAFGSPEAAEYHIGSPSVSLTPMPSNRAKAMFSIPSASSNADSNSSVASVSINSTIIDEESKTIDIEVDVNQMLENAAESIESASRKAVQVDASGASSPLWESNELTVSPSADMSIDIASDQMNIEDATTTVVPHSFLSHERTADGLDSGLLKSSSTSDRAYDRVIGTPASESIVSTKTLAGNASTDLIEGKDSEDAWRAVQSAVSSARQSSELYTDDDNTVELEADMSAILAMVSQGSDDYDSLPALKLADRFPKTTSALVPTTLRMSFGHSVPTHLRGDLTPSRFDYGLSESPVTLSARSCRRRSDSSRRRFSLARTGRLSTASEGSLLDLSRSNCVIGVDETEPDSHLEVDGIEEIVEEFTISCKEIKQLIGPGGCLATKNLNGGFQSSVQSLCERENARYSQVSNSILSFALAVCGEVEEKAQLNSDSEACFFDLVESIEDEKFRLQRWIRNEHGRNETKSIAVAIRRIVDHEWSGWEKIVLESLTTAIAQIGAEMEPECCQLEDCTTALYHLHDLLSISAGKAARRARRRSMARHEVSIHVSIKRVRA